MAKISEYPEDVSPSPQGWLFMAVLQPGQFDSEGDQLYITHKVAPDNIGAQGPTGAQGLPGAAGADGVTGTIIHFGAAAPGAGIGVDGDFYYQTVGGPVFWGPKTAGAWTLGINLKGADGESPVVTRQSTTSLLIAAVSNTFVYTATTNNIGWAVGQRLRAVSDANPANFMEGLVTFVDGASVDINVDLVGGAGTFADWTIFIAGSTGATGAAGAAGAAGATGSMASISGLTDTWLGDYDGFAIDYFEQYSVGAISSFTGGIGWPVAGVGTNCSIVSRTVHGPYAQKRVQITGAGEIGRKMPWGAKWNRIRIGILCRINASASFDGLFAMGVCSGTAAMYGNATPTNWAGNVQLDAATDTFTFAAGTQNNTVVSQSYEGVHRFGGTTNSLVGSFTTAKLAAPTTEASHALYFVEVIRPEFSGATAVTYTQSIFAANTAAKAQFHCTRSRFFSLMQAENPTVDAPAIVTSAIGSAITSGTLGESAGVFDSVNFYWENAANPIELAAFAVFKFY